MTDRALEAAERAGGGVSSICHLVAVGAAREALKSINGTSFHTEWIAGLDAYQNRVTGYQSNA